MRAHRFLLLLLALLGAAPADAFERRLAFTSVTALFDPGELDFDPPDPGAYGAAQFAARSTQRLEFEVGINGRLQSAWFNARTVDLLTDDALAEHDGVADEGWATDLRLPPALALGLEWELAPSEAMVAARAIVDQRFGPLAMALNVAAEYAWGLDQPSAAELSLELQGGLSWLLTPWLSAGLELRSHQELGSAGPGHVEVFAGPAIALSMEGWWAALSVQPELAELHPHLDGLHREPVVHARLLVGGVL